MAERRSKRNIRKSAEIIQLETLKEAKAHTKKIGNIWKKSACERTEDENTLLKKSSDVIKTLEQRARTREKQKQRVKESEDCPEVVQAKCVKLAKEILKCRYVIVYTGAGISTSASIPDYRGPNGVWTLLKKGIEPGAVDLSDADPTYTHMSVSRLYAKGLVKYVVSQNCDGLHMRSGLPRNALSELHGNMFLEICTTCNPVQEHIRLFDTTERTGLRRHKTGRLCCVCGNDLKDSIVHFGEKGPFHSPYNWKQASKVADQADLILCLGSSLKVLRRYPCLWNMQKPVKERPKLVIVNLQWTPKDDLAFLKINGKCDDVMQMVMQQLSISVPKYDRDLDPIYAYAVPLKRLELNTVGKKILVEPPEYEKETVLKIMETLSNTRVSIDFSSGEEDELFVSSEESAQTGNHQNHKAETEDLERQVVAKTCTAGDIHRTKTGKGTARKSPCKLVASTKNGDVKDVKKCSWDTNIIVDEVTESLEESVCPVKNDTIEVSQHNGFTTETRQMLRNVKSSYQCMTKHNKKTEKSHTLPEKCLDVVKNDTPNLNFKNCSVVLDRNVVDDYIFQNAQENFTHSGTVKARIAYKRSLKKCGKVVPRCKGSEIYQEIKVYTDDTLKKHPAPVSPGSARRKRTPPSRNKSTEDQSDYHSSEKKPKRDVDMLGNDVFAGLDDDSDDSDISYNSSTIEVSIPSILKSGKKFKTVSNSSGNIGKLNKSKYEQNDHTLLNISGSSTSTMTTNHQPQPGSSKATSSCDLNIPGDEALSFLAMEEACELPDLTLDSRKVWACYSSWFTALYQSLELKRDESGSRSGAIQVDSHAINDPEVLHTAKEQNTVLLANLAVYDLDAEQLREQQEQAILSGISSPDIQYMGGVRGSSSSGCTIDGMSPLHSFDRSASQSPRGGMLRPAQRSRSISQGCDSSISVCSGSIASPWEQPSQVSGTGGGSSESLSRQPVFAESQMIQMVSDANNSQCSCVVEATEDLVQSSASTSGSDIALVDFPVSSKVTEIEQSTVVRPDIITSPPVVIAPVLENPPIVISPVPVIDITDADSPETNLTDLTKRQKVPVSSLKSKSTSLMRRNSLPASMVPSNSSVLSPDHENSALFAFPEGATGRGPYRPRGRPPNKPGSPVHDPNDAISRIVKQHIENIKEKTATIVETKDQVLKTMGSSAPGWFGKGCRVNKRRKNSR